MKGTDFYDDPDRFRAYWGLRDRENNPNEAIEEPIIWELLGDLQGSRVVDLGCGDGRIATPLLSTGCSSYLGLDGSVAMIEAARIRHPAGALAVRFSLQALVPMA